MAKRDIVISLITRSDKKGLDDATKGLDELGKKADKSGGLFKGLTDKLSSFGDNVGKNLTGKLGPAGDMIDNVGGGLEGMAGTTALAGAGLVAFGGFVAGGVAKLKDLYDQTRNFNEVAGTSWEEGSKLIAVFDDLRVSSEEGASAMGKLTKTVGTSPEVLQKYGIEIAHAKDGTVDMAGTLENVATAFQQTTDPAKRAALGSALFGKSWQNMVPVLEQGGDSLKKLIDGVDKGQIATAKGAAEQDKLFEATDNLHDAIDGLQRALAQDAVPQLIELAHWSTVAVDAMSKINDKIGIIDAFTKSLPGPGFVSKTRDALDELGGVFGKVGDHVGGAAQEVEQFTAVVKPSTQALEALKAGGLAAADAIGTQKIRVKEAADAYKEWTQANKELLEQQEKSRLAALGVEGAMLAQQQAEIAAGDASMELSDKAHIAEVAVRDQGAGSEAAKIATEEHRRAVVDAQQAMQGAAGAAVELAMKQAETSNQTLTAGQQVKVYRDELIKLRAGVSDPDLAAGMDAEIERLRLIAERAESAAAQLRAFNQATAEKAGIERTYGYTDSSGTGVTRRASGGPVWPGQSAWVGEHGPELITWNGNGPADVLSTPESARAQWPTSYSERFPTVTHNPDGTVKYGGDPNTYSGSTYVSGGGSGGGAGAMGANLSFPSLGASPAGVPSSAAPSIFSGGSTTGMLPGYGVNSSGGGSGVTINIYGYVGTNVLKELYDALKQYEAARR